MLHRALVQLFASLQFCSGGSHDLCTAPSKGLAAIERASLLQTSARQGLKTSALDEVQDVFADSAVAVPRVGPVALTGISSRSASNSHIFSVGRQDEHGSLERTKDTTTLFYHVHFPKTGGTTVANLLVGDVCSPFEDATPRLEWDSRCSKVCEMGLTDNQFSCNAGRDNFEHQLLSLQSKRAESLKVQSGAQSVIYVTTLRRGSERLISQWAHEVRNKVFVPSTGVPAYSNESLQLYLTGAPNGMHDRRNGKGWINAGYVSQRNNLQVAQLASVDPWSPAGVNRNDLESAKQKLFTGMWVVGFMKCMDKVQAKLELYGTSLHRGFKRKPAPVTNPTPSKFAFNQATLLLLDGHCSLDNELYDWAWGMAQNPEFKQFAGTC